MMTETITTTFYELHELPTDAAKNAAVQCLADTWFCDDFGDYLNGELSALFPHSDVHCTYSLSSCQGDGLDVYGTFDLQELAALTEHYKDADSFPISAEIAPTITHKHDGRYSYCQWRSSDVADQLFEYAENTDAPIIIGRVRDFACAIDEAMTSLCTRLESIGYEMQTYGYYVSTYIDSDPYPLFGEDGTFVRWESR